MRISRGSQVIGGWRSTEVKERLENGNLLLTDSFYNEEISDWLPLSELQVRTVVKTAKSVTPLCYCGTGLPFQVCCGDGTKY